MNDEHGRTGRRKEPRIFLYPEKWLWGSTRSELTTEQRAVFVDLLCLAITGRGDVDITYPAQLASQLCVPVEVLETTLKRCVETGKVVIKTKKSEKRRIARLVKWNHYQPEYLQKNPDRPTGRPTKQTPSDDDERCACGNDDGTTSDAHVGPLGKDRIGKDRKGEGIGQDRTSGDRKTDPAKRSFLELLRSVQRYPFDEVADGQIYDMFTARHPTIDWIRQLEKKIEWWDANPDALKTAAKPRKQIIDWFTKEVDYQNEGK